MCTEVSPEVMRLKLELEFGDFGRITFISGTGFQDTKIKDEANYATEVG